jgi:uncharacterized membrane protein YcaP (DUF421 family)
MMTERMSHEGSGAIRWGLMLASNTQTTGTFFSSWGRLGDVALGALLFYVFIVMLTRVLGKRTTGQMNNFDWLVTVAVGSLAASGILLESVSLLDAAVGIVVLGVLQWLTTWLSLRVTWFAHIVKGRPRLLLHMGELQADAMRGERIAASEVRAALRRGGYLKLDEANWVILENDGTLTVVPRREEGLGDADALSDVAHDVKESPEPAPLVTRA